MTDQWIEVFRKGKHTDSQGRTRTWSEADLDKIIAASTGKEIPAVCGHPKTDDPAWAWVEAVKKEAGSIWVKFKDIVPEFAEMVTKKMFPHRSVAINPDFSIRHVGFLGAVPPAIKGLAPITHAAEQPMAVIEFADYNDLAIADLFRRMREWIIEKFGSDDADRVIPSDQLGFIQQQAAEEDEEEEVTAGNGGFKQKEEEMGITEVRSEEHTSEAVDGVKAQFSQKIEQLTAENAQLKQSSSEKEKAARKAEIKAFCEGLKKSGKLLPAWEAMGIQSFMEAIEEETETIEFSEGKKETPGAFFRRFLSELPKTVEFEEIAPAEDEEDVIATGEGQFAAATEAGKGFKVAVDQQRLALHRRVTAFAQKHNIPYADALKQVTAGTR